VAAGWVGELRARGAREQRVRVAVEGDGDGAWLAGVPGAELVAREGGGLLVRLSGGAEPELVLDAARAAGTVVHFSLDRPTLTDLFREVIAS
jgi:ABC-2 type transport system ATP-binding protein